MKRLLAVTIAIGCVLTSGAEAATSWIVGIANNTNHDFTMWVKDSKHEGIFFFKDGAHAGKEAGRNDGGQPFVIRKHTRYEAEWTGVPWFWKGRHRRTIMEGNHQHSPNPPGTYGLEMWHAGIDGKEYIVLNDIEGGTQEKIEVGGGDREYELKFYCKDNPEKLKSCKKEEIVMDLLLQSSSEDAQSILMRIADSERAQQLFDKITNALVDGTIDAAKAAAKSGVVP